MQDTSESTFTIVLTYDELRILNDALIELPFKRVSQMINKINSQLAPPVPEAVSPEIPSE